MDGGGVLLGALAAKTVSENKERASKEKNVQAADLKVFFVVSVIFLIH